MPPLFSQQYNNVYLQHDDVTSNYIYSSKEP